MRQLFAVLSVTFGVGCAAQPSRPRLPIIDMHLHAQGADPNAPEGICAPFFEFPARDPKVEWGATFAGLMNQGCENPVPSARTDDAVMSETIGILRRRNIIGVVSAVDVRGDDPMGLVTLWHAAAPDRVIPALGFSLGENCAPNVQGRCITPAEVARLHEEGKFAVFGEVSSQYEGVGPSDAAFDPYLAVAEARDIPVSIHMGGGPPGTPYLGSPRYRASLYSPLLLEEALVRHPKLRVSIMHAGFPMLEDLLALMWAHPQVHVDVAAIAWAQPRPAFHRYLQRIVEAGFGKRVMFGTDQLTSPGLIERALDGIESAPFLTDAQKRDILYNNAARYLRFTDAQIEAHHRQ